MRDFDASCKHCPMSLRCLQGAMNIHNGLTWYLCVECGEMVVSAVMRDFFDHSLPVDHVFGADGIATSREIHRYTCGPRYVDAQLRQEYAQALWQNRTHSCDYIYRRPDTGPVQADPRDMFSKRENITSMAIRLCTLCKELAKRNFETYLSAWEHGLPGRRVVAREKRIARQKDAK